MKVSTYTQYFKQYYLTVGFYAPINRKTGGIYEKYKVPLASHPLII